MRAKRGAYRTVCGISGVHNGEAAEFPIHTSLIHGVDHNLEVVWVEVEQILQLKLKLFV